MYQKICDRSELAVDNGALAKAEIYPVAGLRIAQAKQAFSTRRVELDQIMGISTAQVPRAGDLVLARVGRLGQHKRLELTTGRRAHLDRDDEIIVAFGNRYAADQFEAVVPSDLSGCSLVAAGGIAGKVLSRNAAVKEATEIEPLGLLTDITGEVLNLERFALPPRLLSDQGHPPVVAVVGTSMNAGKTTAVSDLVRGARQGGHAVGVAKITGTGAGGDIWQYQDSGAELCLDFTDAGHATTHRLSATEIQRILDRLLEELTAAYVDLIVIEIADGLLLEETASLLTSPSFRNSVDEIVLAAGCSMSAMAGYQWLDSRGLPPSAVSGRLTGSPLAVREAEGVLECPVVDRRTLSSARWLPCTLQG